MKFRTLKTSQTLKLLFSLIIVAGNHNVSHALEINFAKKLDSNDAAFAEGANYTSFQYHRIRQYDFNNDNTFDRVVCDSTNFITIYDGNSNRIIKRYKAPMSYVDSKGVTFNRKVSGCEVVQIKPGLNSVVASSYFQNNKSIRVDTAQFLLYQYEKGKYVPKKIENINNIRGKNYLPVARNIACTKFPESLIKKGNKAGALCHYSGYHGKSALLKFEPARSGTNLLIKDLTPNSGTIWKNGTSADGSLDGYTWDACKKNNVDGYHTISAAFMDYNNDGLPDLLSVGQHGSLIAYTMNPKATANEGVVFSEYKIINVRNYGVATEFIKMQAINEYYPELPQKCIYLSGEWEGCGGKMSNDVMYCYENKRWNETHLPNYFVSEYRNVTVFPTGRGEVLLKTMQKDKTQRHYAFNHKGILKGHSYIEKKLQEVGAKGFVCRENAYHDVSIKIYRKLHGQSHKTLIKTSKMNQVSNDHTMKKCLNFNKTKHNFSVDLNRNTHNLKAGKGELYFYAFDPISKEEKYLRKIGY